MSSILDAFLKRSRRKAMQTPEFMSLLPTAITDYAATRSDEDWQGIVDFLKITGVLPKNATVASTGTYRAEVDALLDSKQS
ncbi:MAG TPA: hypothetical protein VLG36_04905 [Candidatus Chromulinivoraceae bacterium]|nr:hypothetical protein [Candidatus Chromulinivoraceae bacterium]